MKDVKNKPTPTSFTELVAEWRTVKTAALQREMRAESGHLAALRHVLPAGAAQLLHLIYSRQVYCRRKKAIRLKNK